MPTLRRILEARDRSYGQLVTRYNGNAGSIMSAATRANTTVTGVMIAVPLHSVMVTTTNYVGNSRGN